MATKVCTLCKKSKPLDEFPRQRSRPDGRSVWCKPCHCDKSKAWREANPEKAKKSARDWRSRNPNHRRRDLLRKSYGIEPEDYDRLLAEQDGRCAICGTTEPDAGKAFLCVDHVAGTLVIRGLLCSRCNSAIGFLDHDTALLQAAIEYLSRAPAMEGTRGPRGVHRTGERSTAGSQDP